MMYHVGALSLISQATDWHDQHPVRAFVGIAGYTREDHQAGRLFHLLGINDLAKLEQILSSFINSCSVGAQLDLDSTPLAIGEMDDGVAL